MAHIATKKYSYLAQAGILTGLVLAGLLAGQLISGAVLVSKVGVSNLADKDIMNKLLVPENANLLRLMQFISVLFLFFFPAVLYAKICHFKVWQHLGVKKNVDPIQLVLAVLLIFSALPLVSALRELTLHLPLGDYIRSKILESKTEYMKQALVLGTMRNIGEYFLSLLVMAILPGLFEEIFFRSTLQNLFTRWFKNPVAAILLSAFIFSVFHFEYGDFLGRMFLGAVLGWVFYLTGNIWLNVCMHAAFNALSVTGLYLLTKDGDKIDPAALDDKFNLYLTIGSAVVFTIITIVFYKNNLTKNNQPGVEILPDDFEDPANPSWLQTDANGNKLA